MAEKDWRFKYTPQHVPRGVCSERRARPVMRAPGSLPQVPQAPGRHRQDGRRVPGELPLHRPRGARRHPFVHGGAHAPPAARGGGRLTSRLRARTQFVRDGNTSTLAAAMAAPAPGRFHTARITGAGAPPAPGQELTLPLRGAALAGAELAAQVDKWAAYGCVEPDVATAVRAVTADPAKAPPRTPRNPLSASCILHPASCILHPAC